MSDSPSAPDSGQSVAPHSRAILALTVLLAIEAVALAAVTVYLVIETISSPATSIFSAVALAAVAAIAAIWVAAIAVNVLRGNAWVRGATIVVQVLLIAIAVGSFQGEGANPIIGVGILVPAVLVLVLVFTRSVVAATARRES